DTGFDRKDWLPEAKELANRGYPCLLIDLNLDDPSTAPEYALAASQYFRKQVGVKNVVLVGAGAGADAVVRANARAKSGTIAGTLALAPGSGVDSAGEMQGWKLFVVAKGDDRQYVQTTKKMQKAASNPKRYQTVDGSAHGQHVFEENENAMMSMVNSLLMTVCD
ncbi:MAG: alpha/beta hydrolase, partial [Haladaptatus sp.]